MILCVFHSEISWVHQHPVHPCFLCQCMCIALKLRTVSIPPIEWYIRFCTCLIYNYIHAGGSQAARAVAGSVVVCVLLLLLTVSSVTIYLILKRKGFTLSMNSECMGKQEANNIIVTEDTVKNE